MPIQRELNCTIVHFGQSDIHIAEATVGSGAEKVDVMAIFQTHPTDLTAGWRDSTPKNALRDFIVGLHFTKPESIDEVIKCLNFWKNKKFPKC